AAGGLQAAYQTFFSRFVGKPLPAFCAVGVLALAGVLVALGVGQKSLVPDLKELDLVIDLVGVPGASRPAMSRISTQISRELRSIPGVKNVSAHLGRAIMSDEVSEVSSSELWVSIDPTADHDATVTQVKKVLDSYSGL